VPHLWSRPQMDEALDHRIQDAEWYRETPWYCVQIFVCNFIVRDGEGGWLCPTVNVCRVKWNRIRVSAPSLFPIIAQLSLLELFRDAERAFELTSTAEIFIDCAKTFITSIRMCLLIRTTSESRLKSNLWNKAREDDRLYSWHVRLNYITVL